MGLPTIGEAKAKSILNKYTPMEYFKMMIKEYPKHKITKVLKKWIRTKR